MAHGGGGLLMRQLIEEMFLDTLAPDPDWQHDGASLTLSGERLGWPSLAILTLSRRCSFPMTI